MAANDKRQRELEAIVEKVDDDKAAVIRPLIADLCFMEQRLDALRGLPHIRVHPKDAARQEVTAAGKQYKEVMQAYINAVKVVLTALYRADTGGADELLEKLREFEL